MNNNIDGYSSGTAEEKIMYADIYRVGAVPFTSANMDGAVEWLIDSSAGTSAETVGVSVRLANAYCVALASRDKTYESLFRNSGVNFPDGTPVWAVMSLLSRVRLAGSRPGRVRGPSFFVRSLDLGRTKGIRHFFLGGTDESLDKLLESLQKSYPGVIVAGAYAPPFGPVDDAFIEESVLRVMRSEPHIVWVGLGTPKQDFASTILAEKTGVNCVGVGAAFDFLSGVVPEAPLIFQRCGMEWLYRFCSEPKRLWKRYTIGNIFFVIAVIRGLLFQYSSSVHRHHDESDRL